MTPLKHRLCAYLAAFAVVAIFAAAYLPILNSIAEGVSIAPNECAP